MSKLRTLDIKQYVLDQDDYVEKTFTVTFKPFLSRAAYKQINSLMLSGAMKAKDAQEGNIELTMGDVHMAEDATVHALILNIKDGEGSLVENVEGFVEDLSTENYNMIKEIADDIAGKGKKDLPKENQDS
jgi:hypothetical protein